MGNSARRHFCFCIPVRFAVFISSLVWFLAAGVVSAFAFWVTWAIDNDPSKLGQLSDHVTMSKGWKIGIIIFGVVFAIVCIISLFGFIGAMIRNRRMVKAYSAMTWVAFVISCASTGFILYALYSHNSLIICTDASGNEIACNSFSSRTKIGVTVGTIVGLFLELYLCIVINRYLEQLEDEQSYRNDFGLSKTASYYPHQPLDASANHGLLQPQTGAYPYTDQAHSFGHANH